MQRRQAPIVNSFSNGQNMQRQALPRNDKAKFSMANLKQKKDRDLTLQEEFENALTQKV